MNILKMLHNPQLFFILFLIVLTESSRKEKKYKFEEEEVQDENEYDFIIVGAGLAGCTIATRLSENSKFNVLLLEAGGEPPLISQIPQTVMSLLDPKFNWNLTTVPQRNANNRVLTLNPGKMLGGSGSLNWFNWVRANKRDFDIWKKMGIKGWKWEDVLPYYKKSETDFSIRADKQNSSFSGPIRLTDPWTNVKIYSEILNKFRKLNYNYHDAIDGDQTGFGIARVNIFNNQRQSSYTNYLIPALKRKNLKVINSAVVEKILFNEQKEAIGVLYNKNCEQFTAKAKREIIVSAGTLNTPKILMLSGIGPKKHLKSFGINVISDLKVGNNYQDHYTFDQFFSKPWPNIFNSIYLKDFFQGIYSLKDYSGINVFLNTELSTDNEFPDGHLLMLGPVLDENRKELKFDIEMQLQRPRSKGTVRLASIDPKQQLLIDTNFFDDDYDMQVMVKLAQFFVKLGEFLVDSQNEFSYPNLDTTKCKKLKPKSDDYWRCIVKNNIVHAGHHCCTARMGSLKDHSAVVDDKLRVIGVQNLRVVDASIIPTIISANTQATVMMIAEKGSDLIKSYYYDD